MHDRLLKRLNSAHNDCRHMNLRSEPNGISLRGGRFRTCIFAGLILVGCISCGGSDDGISYLPDFDNIEHNESDANLVINKPKSDGVNLIVTGDRNTITITAETSIVGFRLTGSNNLITFESGIIGPFTIDGADNTIHHSGDVAFTNIIDNGLGNMFIVI